VADLDKDTLVALERARGESAFSSSALDLAKKTLIRGLWGGRAVHGRVLRKFFLSDRWFFTALRGVLWLVPCPELGILMLDWARQYPEAGGLSSVLPVMLELGIAGNLDGMKRLAFAQLLVSGQSDGGSWGLTGSTVLIEERNKQVIEAVRAFRDEGQRRIAVIYGAHHMKARV
jgi:hypothetical protein